MPSRQSTAEPWRQGISKFVVAALVVATVLPVTLISQAADASATSTPPCRSFSPEIKSALEKVVTVAQRTYFIPGIAAEVNVSGEGCWEQATGYADVEQREPLNVHDKFAIGSITKTFTATVILQLVQSGQLSLSAPISQWVPYVQDADRITVEMLLNMTSGIYSEPGGQATKQLQAEPNEVWTAEQVVHAAVAQGPANTPGFFNYSNTNYIILGMIAQAISGESIEELITNRIIQPLHLDATSFPTTRPPASMPRSYDIKSSVTVHLPGAFGSRVN